MAEGSSTVKSRAEVSQWGLPLNWDGHVLRPHPFFCPSIEELGEDAWGFIKKSTNLSWVIIPRRKANADNDE